MDDDLMLEVYEGNFRAGNRQSLMAAILHSLSRRQMPPEWAMHELCEAIRKVQRFEYASWDEALGKPHIGRKIGQVRAERAVQWVIFQRVHQLRRQKPKPKDIFQLVADELKLSRATCKRYFDNLYRFKKPRRY